MVAGLDHTRDYVVQREIQVAAGQPLSQQDLLDTQSKLYDLGIFSQVDTAVQNPEGSDPQKNVLVQVQEAKRYTFTYGLGLEFETGLPSGTSSPTGATGVSPRVGFDITRLNVGGRDQTLTFQSHVGRLQQRGLISYEIPKLFNNDRFKLFYTIFYDNSLDVSTFTSQRLEGKIDLRQQIGKLATQSLHFHHLPLRLPPRQSQQLRLGFFTCRIQFVFLACPRRRSRLYLHPRQARQSPRKYQGPILHPRCFRRVQLCRFASGLRPRSRPGFHLLCFRPAQSQVCLCSLHHSWSGTGLSRHAGSAARSLSRSMNLSRRPARQEISVIPLPEVFFAGGGNSHRGFGLNQAGPRDPDSGFPVGGSALFVNSEELRFPPISLPYLGEGFGFAIFHDMGNVFTAGHDMLKGLMRWHQPDPAQCLLANPGAILYHRA